MTNDILSTEIIPCQLFWRHWLFLHMTYTFFPNSHMLIFFCWLCRTDKPVWNSVSKPTLTSLDAWISEYYVQNSLYPLQCIYHVLWDKSLFDNYFNFQVYDNGNYEIHRQYLIPTHGTARCRFRIWASRGWKEYQNLNFTLWSIWHERIALSSGGLNCPFMMNCR